MQQICVFVFVSILIVSFFVLLIMMIVLVITSEIEMEKMFNRFIKEIENEISNNKRVVDSFRKVKENSNGTYNKSQIK